MIMEDGAESDLTAGHHHHLLDWLNDSISFIPSFLDDPYAELNTYEWWNSEQDPVQLHTPATVASVSKESDKSPTPTQQPELSKKRKQQVRRRADEGGGENEEDGEAQRRKKAPGKSSVSSGDARWAEQLLNPCAAAVESGHLSRVQHLLFVLRELASPSGDANHRLAAHGLRALAQHLSSVGASVPPLPAAAVVPASYATTEPKLFRSVLIKFHEISPWFALPNALANASILHALDASLEQRPRPLHLIDIGISHGVQWPTLLEALTRRPGGPPPLVRLTVAGSIIPHGPFSSAPPGYDFATHLLRYAKSINLNLYIDHADTLSSSAIQNSNDTEAVFICTQFRMGHTRADERAALLSTLCTLRPVLVVLSEIDWERAGSRQGFLAGFARRAGLLWRFLESTGAAFKGRESAERRVVEGEAAGWLEGLAEGEGAAEWRERMAEAGFREVGFSGEAVEAGRALLRKYDSNWEMRVAGETVAAPRVGLRWKGQPVSFCSLWKLQ